MFSVRDQDCPCLPVWFGASYMEKEMVTHPSILAWKTLWTEEPGRLQSMGLQGVRQDWETSLSLSHIYLWASQVALVVKTLPANIGDKRDTSSICGSGRFPEEKNDNPLQYSYLEHPMDRGAWCTTVHGVTKELYLTEWLNTHTP